MNRKSIFTLIVAAASAVTAYAQGGYSDGIDYYNADRFDKARIILEKTINDPGTDQGLAYFYLGALDIQDGDINKAKANFEKGIAAAPNSGYNYVGLGWIALQGGDAKTAKNQFNAAVKMDKKDAGVPVFIARAYYLVDPTTYAKEIEKNIAQALKQSKNKCPDVYVLQGDIAAVNGEIGQAAGNYEQAIVYEEEAGTVNPEAYVKYANLYNRVNHKYAIDKLIELKSKMPTSALAQSELAEKYYDAEQYGKAAAEYREYMNNPNHFQVDEQRYSQLLFFDNKNAESRDLALNVLKQDPNNYYMYRMVMLNDNVLENYPEAEQYAKKLFAAPNAELTSMDYTTYANILQKLNRPQEAVAVLEKGYKANPEKNKGMIADISSIYLDLEDYPNAVKYLQDYVDLGESKLADRYDLATYYGALAKSMAAGSPERTEAANKGISLIDENVGSAVAAGPFYRMRANLLQVRDGGDPTAELEQAYEKMMDAYGDASTQPDAFKTGCLYSIIYYTGAGADKDKAQAAYDKLAALAPDYEQLGALRDLISKMK